MNLESKISIETYKKIIDKIPYGVIIADKEGKIIFWNEISYKTFKEDLIHSPLKHWVEDWGVYTADKKTKFKTEELPLVRALNGEIVTGEKLFIKNDGIKEGTYIKVSAFPIYNMNNKDINSAVVIFEDITHEQALYDSVINKINELESYLKDVLDLRKDSEAIRNKYNK